MVEGTGIPEIDEINSKETLEAYLNGKPIEWSRQIAVRSALRVFPFVLQQTQRSQVNDQISLQLIVSVWRCISISMLGTILPNADLRIAANATNAANAAAEIFNTDFAASTSAARAAASYAADTAYAPTATVAAFNAAKTADCAARAGDGAKAPTIAAEMWKCVRNDLYLLSEGAEPLFEVLYKYIGSGETDDTTIPVRYWHSENARDFVGSDSVRGTRWEIISDWYFALLGSRFSTTPWGEIGSDIDFEIASKLKDFWDRDPDEVIVDVAEIVGWPDYGQSLKGFDELKERQISFGKAIIREFPINPNKDVLNSYLDTLNAQFDEFDFKRFNEFWFQCQGNKLDIFATSPDQRELWAGFDQTHYSIMQISPYKDEFNSLFEMEDNHQELAPLLEAKNSKYGASFIQEGDSYHFDQSGDETDLIAADTVKVQQLYPRLQSQLEEFMSIANALNNQLGWRGISELVNRLSDDLSLGLDHVAENVSVIWLDIVELGSYWDQDKLARESDSKEIDPLDPDRKRKLEHLITTASVFVRSFPTALELDEEARKFKQNQASLAAARAVIDVAKSIELMAERDANLMIGAFEAEKRGDVQGGKAGAFGFFTSRNFVSNVAAGLVIMGVGAASPAIYAKSSRFLREASPAILQLWADAPSSYSTALRILIEQAKDEHNLPNSPRVQPNPAATRREDDEETPN